MISSRLGLEATAMIVNVVEDMTIATCSSWEVSINWSVIKTRTVIVIGGPGVNYLVLYYNKTLLFSWIYKPSTKSVIYSNVTGNEYKAGGVKYDYAVIALIKDPDTGKHILIVWGLQRCGTQAACMLLQNYNKYDLSGVAMIIKWTDNGNKKVDEDDVVEIIERRP